MSPPASACASPLRSTPNSSTTPTIPITTPAVAIPCGRSSSSKRAAISAVKIGADDTRMPVSAEAMCCSP